MSHKIILLLILILSSSLTFATPRTEPFEPFQYIDSLGDGYIVIDAKEGRRQIDRDLYLDQTLHQYTGIDDEYRENTEAHALDAVYNTLKALYEVSWSDIKIGDIYVGIPLTEPEAVYVAADVVFTFNNAKYKARIVKYIPKEFTANGRHTKCNYFIYQIP